MFISLIWLSEQARAARVWAFWIGLAVNGGLLLFTALTLSGVIICDFGGSLTVNRELMVLFYLFLMMSVAVEALIVLGLISCYSNRSFFDPTAARKKSDTFVPSQYPPQTTLPRQPSRRPRTQRVTGVSG